ncbi:integrase catalytic domain-containing protein [Ralstonia mannitolilytica]|uniref:Integrase catalytic domain-containing protein n=1 Tax=Ralstonia mannitolilytica TaxID=105219 RepID=A0AAD2AQK1_9RALS|nr:transposase family protein [Ralstonia mannitolilytica]MBY4717472.1 transposase family protein [Ralstonia mannitolilytica]CAJ0684618.1 hypothetical protein R77591_02541 [Ralstonia mannitolilytica]CAJ0874751.1 hypothetical protein R77569_02647 [Ralstonia mannitolilytica]
MRVEADDIAVALAVTPRSVRRRAERENWPFTLEAVRGGHRKLFALTDLPVAVRKAVERHQHIAKRADAAIEKAAERHARGEQNLKALMETTAPGVKARLDGRFEIVRGWERWFAAAQPMRRSASWEPYAAAYNAREITMPPAVLAAFPDISGRSVQRWVLDYERNGMAGLIDQLDGKARKDVNVFTTQPALEKAAIALLIARPHLGVQNLLDLISQAAIDPETGEHLFNVPTYHQAYRFLKAWKAKNAELLTAATNPDQWKNKYMVAFGDASGDVVRLNQRWEMDATPADWMLTDEDGRERRYSASVVVDVYSRRMVVVLAPTPKTETHKYALRLALLLWGRPEEIWTDNGKDSCPSSRPSCARRSRTDCRQRRTRHVLSSPACRTRCSRRLRRSVSPASTSVWPRPRICCLRSWRIRACSSSCARQAFRWATWPSPWPRCRASWSRSARSPALGSWSAS